MNFYQKLKFIIILKEQIQFHVYIFFYMKSQNSLKNGISMDEIYENENWKIQKNISINIFNHYILGKPFEEKFQKNFE